MFAETPNRMWRDVPRTNSDYAYGLPRCTTGEGEQAYWQPALWKQLSGATERHGCGFRKLHQLVNCTTDRHADRELIDGQ